MNTAQLLEYYKDKNLNERFRYTTNQNQDYFPFDENLNTDWQDAIFQNAIQQKYNLSIAGGGKNMRYRISGEYFDQEGILICTGMKRFAFRSNFDIELNKCQLCSYIYQSEKNKRRWRRIKQRNPNCNLHVSLFPGQTS